MNIYIKPSLENKLRQEDNMSGLVNELLERHYNVTHDDVTQHKAQVEDEFPVHSVGELLDQRSEYEVALISRLVLDPNVKNRAYDPSDDTYHKVKVKDGRIIEVLQ